MAHMTSEARIKRFGSDALPKAYHSNRPHDLAGLAIFKTCREEQQKGTPPAGGVSCLDKHILECIRSCQDERME